jgi:hypothetical protein
VEIVFFLHLLQLVVEVALAVLAALVLELEEAPEILLVLVLQAKEITEVLALAMITLEAEVVALQQSVVMDQELLAAAVEQVLRHQ